MASPHTRVEQLFLYSDAMFVCMYGDRLEVRDKSGDLVKTVTGDTAQDVGRALNGCTQTGKRE